MKKLYPALAVAYWPRFVSACTHPFGPFSRAKGSRLALLQSAALLCAAIFISGCGKDPETSDLDAPLDGRAVTKASQLVGTWMHASAGEFTGLEFLKDGKTIATLPMGAVTFQYSVLEGGRLSLERAGGMTTLYSVTLAGDQMEITPESPSGRAAQQRLQRIESGQTLAQALQERNTALAAARERRFAELQKLTSQQELVMVKAETNGPPAVLAVRLEQLLPQVRGSVVMVENPGNINPLAPVRVHPLTGSAEAMDEFTDRIRLSLQVRPATVPTGQEKYQGQISLIAEGEHAHDELKGEATFPESWMGAAAVVLKRDRSLHQTTIAQLETQTEVYQRALAAVSAPLGGRALLSGQKTFSNGSAPLDISIELEATAAPDSFTGSYRLGPASEQNANAQAALLLGAGALYINLASGEQWRLQLDESGKSFQGEWRPNTRTDFISHGGVALQLDRTWTIEQVQAEREAIRSFVEEDLRAAVEFAGFVDVGKPGEPERWPIWVELQTHADGKATGRAWLLGQAIGVALSGSVSGVNFNLQSTGLLEGSANSRNLAQQRWNLSLDQMDPAPTLTGRMNGAMGGGGTVELRPVDSSRLTEVRSALVEALSDQVFQAVNNTISRKTEPTFFRLEFDPSTGAVSGDVVGEDLTGSTSRAIPPGLVTGSVAEERGHVLLKLTAVGSPEPVRKREIKTFEYTAAASLRDEEGLMLFGWGALGSGNQDWLTFTPTEKSAAESISPEQQLRLAAQRLGAGVEEPANPSVGDSATLIVNVTERDARVGQLFYADGRYTHRNSIAAAALHAGLAQPGEVCVVQLTYGPPFTSPVEPVEQNGVASQRGTFRENNTLPTYTIKRVQID